VVIEATFRYQACLSRGSGDESQISDNRQVRRKAPGRECRNPVPSLGASPRLHGRRFREKHGQTFSTEDMWVNIGLNKREIGKAACINKYSENCNF
jgi:hypothetical protein